MKLVKMDPPGTWCFCEAFFEMLRGIEGRHFLEVGCGAGDISLRLLELGYTGIGLDFSPIATAAASRKLMPYIEHGKWKLIEANLLDNPPLDNGFAIVMSFFVMEHVQDDLAFLKILKSYARPGGHVAIAVPGRKDKWSLEDETARHFRRYNRQDLLKVAEKAGLIDPEVWSVAVPISNIVFGLSKLSIRRSQEKEKLNLSQEDQTKTSGVRDIPFKTVFPPFFKIFLNRVTLWPFFIIQRFFYHTGLGLTMLVKARCT